LLCIESTFSLKLDKNMAWKKHIRKGGAAPDQRSLITIRRQSIAFNAHFSAIAQLDKHTRVTIHADSEEFKIGLDFHSDSSDHASYALCNDGGGSSGRGRSAEMRSLFKENKWIAAIGLAKEGAARRFEPQWSSADSFWIVKLAPSFEFKVSDKSVIPSDLSGIYRYRRGNDVVYIGRGVIRSRASSPEREIWDFDSIEYSVVADVASQEKWESHWLNIHTAEHDGLPFYNRIAGKKVTKAE
jgi:hypothetical protein